MANLNWRDAIEKVLSVAQEPMHYSDIAQAIIDQQLRKTVGATPASTVASTISTSLAGEGAESPFIRVERGVYGLASIEGTDSSTAILNDEAIEDAREMGLINAFGMFWHRNEVNWDVTAPPLLGQQQSGSQSVDFSEQSGVYLLYDGNRVIYVGQVLGTRMSTRLREHTRDRLRGRWDRFSWFGVRDVDDVGGTLLPAPQDFGLTNLISTMEALLIEGLEPPQNRRQGDGFNAVEFQQVLDPSLRKLREQKSLQDALKKLGV